MLLVLGDHVGVHGEVAVLLLLLLGDVVVEKLLREGGTSESTTMSPCHSCLVAMSKSTARSRCSFSCYWATSKSTTRSLLCFC